MSRSPQAQLYDVGGVMLPRPFRANRLGHIGLYVGDMAASHRFYSELLGLRQTDSLPGIERTPDPRGRFYTFNSDHHALVVLDKSVGLMRDDRYANGITVNQISFQVGALEEVVNAQRVLQDWGMKIARVGRDVPGSNWAVYFEDPDRHTVELYYGMEQIGWDRRSKPVTAFGRYLTMEAPALPQPAELDEIRAVEAGAPDTTDGHRWDDPLPANYDVGGVLLPRPFKLIRGGPVTLAVSDLDAAVTFYTERLGLQLTEESHFEGRRIAHLRAGTEHHVMTLAPLELRARLGLTERSTLMAHGLQVGGYRQLRAAVAFLESRGCRQTFVPDALHTGIDYAAHFADPDGHLVQLYFSMEQVGWDGRPRPADQRPPVLTPWPETLEGHPDHYADRTFQGPLG